MLFEFEMIYIVLYIHLSGLFNFLFCNSIFERSLYLEEYYKIGIENFYSNTLYSIGICTYIQNKIDNNSSYKKIHIKWINKMIFFI